MVRFLLYANEFDVEGLVASAGTFANVARKQNILDILDRYAKVYANLRQHDPHYPTPDKLRSVTWQGRDGTWGTTNVGTTAKPLDQILGAGKDSEASDALINVVDRSDPRPVWVCVWGGSREVAQALWKVRATRSPTELERFLNKLRIYLVANQDSTTPWLLDSFPSLFVILSEKNYMGMFWNMHRSDPKLTNLAWINANVRQGHGPLGAVYPQSGWDPKYPGVQEGDTPSFLHLVSAVRGLNDPEKPDQPGWGGQFVRPDLSRNHWFDDPAGTQTVSRWRAEVQADFARRVGWMQDPSELPAGEVSAAAPALGVAFDLQGFLDREIQAGAPRIVIPPGRYRVAPRDRQHLVLRGLKDVQIIAEGVEMVCTETTRAVTITHCTNVTLRGLTIDYDPLPFTQGRIAAVSADKQVYEVELFEGYPEATTVRNFKYEVFRPDTRTLRCEDRALSHIEVVDARHLRLTCPGRRDSHLEQPGDLIVIGSEYAPHGSAPHAVECSDSVNVRLEDIVLFASNCFGFIELNCDGSTYERCRIDRRSPETDPVKRASPRLRSLDADAYHSKYAIRGPAYLGCSARFMGDDCINICGDYHLIMDSDGREVRVLAKGRMNIQPGDPVELVLYAGERLPDARAVSIQPVGPILEEERAFLARQSMDAGLKNGRELGRAYRVTLDRDVTIPRGGLICSANRIGNGFTVKNCNFGFNRSRGILIKASHGEISGNHMEGCWMSAILVSPEYWWLEAGSSTDLTIAGNTITNCTGVPIRVAATGGKGDIAPAGAHRNITITGNTVTGCAMPGILVTSTTELRVSGNILKNWAGSERPPEEMRLGGLTELKPIIEIHCTP
jgi:parallel beta-helix repeat protein